jgi:hypothetical protein
MDTSSQHPVDLEQPVDDVIEQRAEVPPPPLELGGVELPLEADPADAAEQIIEVDTDEEEQV